MSSKVKNYPDLDSIPLDVICLDAVVLLYHLGVSARFKATTQQQNVVQQALERLNEAQARINGNNGGDGGGEGSIGASAVGSSGSAPQVPAAHLEGPVANLHASVVEGLRLMTYSRAIIMGDRQRVGLGGISSSIKR